MVILCIVISWFQVEENEGRLAIALVDNSHIEQLAKRVLMVLMDKIEGKLIIPDLQTKHLEKFGIELSDDDIMLLSEQKDFIEVYKKEPVMYLA